jgi:hypothetical protein
MQSGPQMGGIMSRGTIAGAPGEMKSNNMKRFQPRPLVAACLLMLSRLELSQALQAQEPLLDRQPSELRSHETIWERRDEAGKKIGSYVELQSGLNRQLENGTWTRSSDELEIINGFAVAQKTQFRASFAPSSDQAGGVFDILLPNGAGRIRGQCVGLAYTSSNGDSVFLLEIRAVQGQVRRTK